MSPARSAAEKAARSSYGRLVAMLAVRTRDIAAAEDALSDAFVSALRTWPERGVPDNPDAWLLTAARNTVKNMARHRNVAETAAVAMALEQSVLPSEPAEFPDQRLRLLFVCAHPAIDESVRTPLMLQTVLGLDAAHIAAAFLVAPTTLGQRLVRAKAKIKDAGLRFELPSTADMADRMADVLNAIYVAFGTGWDSVAGAEAGPRDLTGEALFLCRLIVTFLPNEPEARGLLALMLYCEARRPARRGEAGEFIPLREQDHHRWSRDMIVEAEGHLISASRHGTFGRFQCEAAIQSVHVQAPLTGRTNHEALETLYQLLAHHCPSVGVLVSQAAALVDAGDADKALVVLGRLPEADVQSYQPYWVTRANALGAKGDLPAAARALDVAIGLTEDPAVRAFLVQSRRF